MNLKKGSIADKDSAKNALIEELMEKARALNELARKIADNNLKEISNVTRSGLKKLRERKFLQKANVILENFKANVGAMKEYGIVDNDHNELETVFVKYEDAYEKKVVKQPEGKSSSKDLAQLFAEIDDILENELDPMMETIKNDNPEFYKQYKAARVIKDL